MTDRVDEANAPIVAEGVRAAHPSSTSRVLVTGGSSGLGAALCRALIARGDQVVSADLNLPAEPIEGVGYLTLDVRSDQDWLAKLCSRQRSVPLRGPSEPRRSPAVRRAH